MKFERKSSTLRSLMAVLCTVLVVPGDTLAYAPQFSVPPGRHQCTPTDYPAGWKSKPVRS